MRRFANTLVGTRETRPHRGRAIESGSGPAAARPDSVQTAEAGFAGAMRCTVERGRLDLMTAAVKAVLEQAKRLSPEELAELRAELDALEDPAWAAA